jgi:2-polyprenyl-6-hydroxyphenyl methylase/3-demethylubiquinone-9 3-methyltransferase
MRRLKWEIAQWFELRWWKNYLRNKNKDEYSTWKKNYWNNILDVISEKVRIDNTLTICDLGCGPAGVFIALINNKIVAVDPLINEYEKHTPFFEKRDYPNCTFTESTIEEFETEEKFDVVFCMNAINHVHDIEKGFEQLKNLCSENGKIVVSIDAHNFSFFKHLFRLVPGDVLHPHQFDLDEYKEFLKTEGLKILQTTLLKHEFFFDHYLIVAGK